MYKQIEREREVGLDGAVKVPACKLPSRKNSYGSCLDRQTDRFVQAGREAAPSCVER